MPPFRYTYENIPNYLQKAIKITINKLNTRTCYNLFDNYISHEDTVNINCETTDPSCLQVSGTICSLFC